jgi:8-amino-7-oxononanoate synthase
VMPPNFPGIVEKLLKRSASGMLRKRNPQRQGIDFSSNDYLGLARLGSTKSDALSGAGGSPLLTGYSDEILATEQFISGFHKAEEALLFSSGFAANLGLMEALGYKGSTILFDELVHASLRDGIRLSRGKTFHFEHNNLKSLEDLLEKARGDVYVVTESVFSMDGDLAPLKEILSLCQKHNARLIVDEAHALGLFGESGEGLVGELKLEQDVFCRVYTFGKALGLHGAAILSNAEFISFLVNFCRSYIYSTGIPPALAIQIREHYSRLTTMKSGREHLRKLCGHFDTLFGTEKSFSPIRLIIPGKGPESLSGFAKFLVEKGIDARPVFPPTVPQGTERIRICIHVYNTVEEISLLHKYFCDFYNGSSGKLAV